MHNPVEIGPGPVTNCYGILKNKRNSDYWGKAVFEVSEQSDGEFWTTSRVVKYVYVYLRGGTVVLTKVTPVDSLLGGTRYKTAWLLRAGE